MTTRCGGRPRCLVTLLPGSPGTHPIFGRQAQASASSSRVSPSSCGMVLVRPMIGMKLASPSQRGTTCWWRWAGSRRPRPALVHPEVEALRVDTDRSTVIARLVSAAISAASSTEVSV